MNKGQTFNFNLQYITLFNNIFFVSVNNIPGIEEVNMIKDDGTVIHFNNPKVRVKKKF